jgi:hypothetical protein
VGEQDRRFTGWNHSTCPLQIVGPEEVGIVNATDPEAVAMMFHRPGFIEQEGQSRLLQRGDFGEEVMVAEDRKAFRVEEGDQAPHRHQRAVEGSVNLRVVIAGQDDGIVENGRHDPCDPVHDPVIEIAVKVGELEEAKSLESRREAGDYGLMFLDTEIEHIPQALCSESAGGHRRADDGIHRKEPLQRKGAEPLSHLPAAKSFLKMEASQGLLLTEAAADALGDVLAVPDHPETIGPSLKILMWKSGNQEKRED